MKNGIEKRSILVVDDDRQVLKMLRSNLENDDLQVQEAATGVDCIDAALNGEVGLILMEIGLADLNGWGILCLLKLSESTSHIPVIMMSADPPDRALMNHPQPDDYIQKPFDMRDLLLRLEKFLPEKSKLPGNN